jgi:large exoprotein involved in heme utilization and adhesion
MSGGAWISAATDVSGKAGPISLSTGVLSMSGGAWISASSLGRGDAGTIRVDASDSISLTDEGGERFSLDSILLRTLLGPASGIALPTGFFSGTVIAGNGGIIDLRAPQITVTDGAIVATSTVGGGNAGDVLLSGDRIRIANGGLVDSARLLGRGGAAGDVTLAASESIEVVGSRPGFGDASRVSSSSLGSGETGTVTLEAPRIVVDGGAVATTALRAPSRFSSQSQVGAGGDIKIAAGDLIVRGGGRVDASSFIDGPGGNIDVNARQSIVVEGAGSGIASRTGGPGTGGDVTLHAPDIDVTSGGEVSARSTPGLGDAGEIFASFAAEGLIGKPPAEATGKAGAISLQASEIHLLGGAITTNAATADGGDIGIVARDRLHLIHGEITATVNDGTGGNITIDPTFVILDQHSKVIAQAGTGTGGNIQITADVLLVSLESVISASSQFGTNGVVAIDSPEVDLAGTLSALPASFLDAASLLRQRCAQRAEAGAGSFVVAGTSALSASPDAPLEAASDGVLGTPAPDATLTGMVLGEDAEGRKIGVVIGCGLESQSS